jgi:hypothetical protein
MAEKPITLTDLADQNKQLSARLDAHTKARGYLWQLAIGEEDIQSTKLTIAPMFPRTLDAAFDPSAGIALSQLPQDALELILSVLLDHEEQSAFKVWEELEKNTKAAKEIIAKVAVQREEARKAQEATAEDEEFTLPTSPVGPGDDE